MSDTDPEAQRVHLDLSRTVMSLSRGGLARQMPGASPEELGLRFVALHYGADLAEDLRVDLAARRR